MQVKHTAGGVLSLHDSVGKVITMRLFRVSRVELVTRLVLRLRNNCFPQREETRTTESEELEGSAVWEEAAAEE